MWNSLQWGRLQGAAVAVAALACVASPAAASVTVGGSVEGDTIFAQWQDPVFIGEILDAATGLPFFAKVQDWSATAVYDLGSAGPAQTTTLTWGDLPGGTPPVFSSLTFTGGVIPFSPTKNVDPFSLGSISYTNGTSNVGTGIFGATLVFYANDGVNDIPIGSDFVALTSTVNDGTQAQNADWVNFQNAGVSFNIYEGAAASAQLMGVIKGDPHTLVTGVTLDPGQGGNGFIGNSLPAGAPEPAGWAMLLVGLGGLGALLRGRKAPAAA
jgi:hypothetical protein